MNSLKTVLRGATLASLVGVLAVGVMGAAGTPAPAETPAIPDARADARSWDMRGAEDRSVTSSSRDTARMALADITVTIDGTQTPVTTAASTVGEALAEAGIVLGVDDIVTPAASTAPAPGMEVTVQRVARTVVTESDVHGTDGERVTSFEVTTVDGVETARVELASSTVVGEIDRAIASGDTVTIGQAMAAERGWTGAQWTCLYKLWMRESRWSVTADNPTSSAYGIPQALPGSKMSSHGADWRTNPATQIAWGLDYIAGRYGSPCGAWGHSERYNWY